MVDSNTLRVQLGGAKKQYLKIHNIVGKSVHWELFMEYGIKLGVNGTTMFTVVYIAQKR